MQRFLPPLLAAFLTACASTASAPAQTFQAPGLPSSMSISGSLVQTEGFLDVANDVQILIDGRPVAGGLIVNGSTEFAGEWKGAPILADCQALHVANFWKGDRVDVKCTVFVSGQRAASFVMVP